MTLSKSRKIVVDSQRYQWRAKYAAPTYIGDSPVIIYLVVLSSIGACLKAELLSKKLSPDQLEGLAEHKASLTPKDVERVIHAAVLAGWDPTVKAKPFLLAAGPDLMGQKSIEAK
jgi:hypothetical protein